MWKHVVCTEELNHDLLHNYGCHTSSRQVSQPRVPVTGLIKGILEGETLPSWEYSSEQQGNLDGESQTLIGA